MVALDHTDMKVDHYSPSLHAFTALLPLQRKELPLERKRRDGLRVGGVSTLLLDNASSVWFEGEGFFAWLCYGVGNDVEIECIRHSGKLWVSAPTPMPLGTSCIDHNMEAHVACFHQIHTVCCGVVDTPSRPIALRMVAQNERCT